MQGHWSVMLPMLEGAEVVVEIGADKGATTRELLKLGCLVHSIDPSPAPRFEKLSHERLAVHRDLSLNVLPTIERIDAVLIDGDHNWYTVFHELKLLDARESFPLTFLHDIGWPYGRRDGYYNPETIPAEYRQPYERSGVIAGRSELSENGANPTIAHATHEGGPRNGVLTAVEDFLAHTDRQLSLRTFPQFHGLGIIS